ncbi:MAG: hypothetical protein MUC33_18230, partial [Desulfobacterales bacterium]|nr:hypothetical protein [Desulfobacterales bacterium]
FSFKKWETKRFSRQSTVSILRYRFKFYGLGFKRVMAAGRRHPIGKYVLFLWERLSAAIQSRQDAAPT